MEPEDYQNYPHWDWKYNTGVNLYDMFFFCFIMFTL